MIILDKGIIRKTVLEIKDRVFKRTDCQVEPVKNSRLEGWSFVPGHTALQFHREMGKFFGLGYQQLEPNLNNNYWLNFEGKIEGVERDIRIRGKNDIHFISR